MAQAGRWQSQQRQDVQAEACWRELRATRAGIGGSDRHRHQEVGVLIQKRVQTAAIGDAVPPTWALRAGEWLTILTSLMNGTIMECPIIEKYG